MSGLASWRVALRLARRDALRHRGRSALVLAMISLPVLAVTAADVVIATQDVSSVESLDRRIGAAAAEVTPAGVAPVVQGVDPEHGAGWTTPTGNDGHETSLTATQVAGALGGARLLPIRTSQLDFRTDHGVASAGVTEVDLRDPLTRGLVRRTSGRWPARTDEVVVNQALLDDGYAVGDRLELDGDDAPSPRIVGVVESGESRTYPVAVGLSGSLGIPSDNSSASWLVGGGPVSWEAVRALNRIGGTVLSRAVVTDPPPASEIPDEVRGGGGSDDQAVAVIVLIVAMALLEVVLLAGPAFAVTARRQARTLALLAATGGTPAQSRRVVVGGGVVLGTVAASAGVVLGIGLGRALAPVAQRHSDTWFGPFDVPWPHLAGIALFGLASAVLATVAPAWVASRQDVVAVLAGRRADRPPSLRSPILGVLLLGAGVAGSAYGAVSREGAGATYAIAASAVAAVLGMILLVPIVVVGVARLAGRLPLSTRYAARDAARHRTRTVPAVAAVAATVAGVVALGIGVSSDEAENRETYEATLPRGAGLITSYGPAAAWPSLRAAASRELPGASLTPVRGLREQRGEDAPTYSLDLSVAGHDYLRSNTGGSWGTSNLVGTADLALPALGLDASQRAAAARVLRRGGVVAFSDRGVTAASVDLVAHRWDPGAEEDVPTRAAAVPAMVVPVEPRSIGPQAILSEQVARRLKVPVGVVGFAVDGRVSPDQEKAAGQALAAVDADAVLYVERGYQTDDETLVIQLVLAALGGVLMLGGTLTATFLALSDARADLATLSAVGASPRRRRTIAASYALVVGFVGAVLGAAVGFIPGIAVTYPLTYLPGDSCSIEGSGSCASTGASTGPFVDVPWLLVLALVVGLPLVTAAVVGLTARSRLPLAARAE